MLFTLSALALPGNATKERRLLCVWVKIPWRGLKQEEVSRVNSTGCEAFLQCVHLCVCVCTLRQSFSGDTGIPWDTLSSGHHPIHCREGAGTTPCQSFVTALRLLPIPLRTLKQLLRCLCGRPIRHIIPRCLIRKKLSNQKLIAHCGCPIINWLRNYNPVQKNLFNLYTYPNRILSITQIK